MKILVIQQKMIGDVLATTVVCANLKLIYPDAQIDYLIYPFTVAVVQNNPYIDKIILFNEEYRSSKFALYTFLMDIKKSHYDLVIDAYGKLESNLVVVFSAAKTKIGFYKNYTHFLYTKTVKEIAISATTAGSAIENRLNLLAWLSPGIALENRPKIFLTDSEIQNGQAILQRNKVDFSKKIYMIGVVGSENNKTYPPNFMAKLLDFIVLKTNATVIFNYIPTQINQAQHIFDLCETKTQSNIKIDLVPQSIREFLSITFHCNALIGNEGGAVNMAKALNKPTFTIFSTWIIKEAWNAFENGTSTVSVHLKDFKPEIYGSNSPKEMKNQAEDLYKKFNPELIFPVLEKYLQIN